MVKVYKRFLMIQLAKFIYLFTYHHMYVGAPVDVSDTIMDFEEEDN